MLSGLVMGGFRETSQQHVHLGDRGRGEVRSLGTFEDLHTARTGVGELGERGREEVRLCRFCPESPEQPEAITSEPSRQTAQKPARPRPLSLHSSMPRVEAMPSWELSQPKHHFPLAIIDKISFFLIQL